MSMRQHSEGMITTDDANASENRGLTLSATMEAVAVVMRAANPDVPPDLALASRIAGDIEPALRQALASGRASSGQELLAGPGFATIVTQYLGSPSAGYLDPETRKAMLAQMEQVNVTSAAGVALARSLGLDLPGAGASRRPAGLGSAGVVGR